MEKMLRLLEKVVSHDLNTIKKTQSAYFDNICTKQCLLYGAGNAGKNAAQTLKQNSRNILGFIDNNPKKWNTSFDGIPVFSLENAKITFGNSYPVLISIINREINSNYKNIVDTLNRQGMTHVMPYAYYLWSYGKKYLPWFAQGDATDIVPYKSQIKEAAELFHDKLSLQTFVEMARTSIFADFESFSEPVKAPQYFDQDILNKLQFPVHMVDVGAYDGDTLKSFLENVGSEKLGSWVALEPDPLTFNRLKNFVCSLPVDIQNRITLINAAASDKEGIAYLVNEDSESAMVTDEKTSFKITLNSLDSLDCLSLCNYIKMYIEGYEKDAINGAKNIIKRNSPSLAICVYHKPKDFFEIPLCLYKLTNRSNFMMRRYGSYFFETVCYLI